MKLTSSFLLSFLFLFFCLQSCYSFYIAQRPLLVKPSSKCKLQMISHGKGFNKLGLPADQRKALLRGLVTHLIRHGKIQTTLARAKALRKPADHMITLAKKGTLHHRRQALAYIYDKTLVASLFKYAPERYGERNGGYTRVIKDPVRRRGDHAQMAFIELV